MTALGKNEQNELSEPLLIVLHLAPGVIFAVFFFVLARIFIQHGLTGYLALIMAIPFCLVPIEIGVMLFWSIRYTGKRSLSAVIGYRQKGTVVEYVVFPLLLFLCWGVLSILISPLLQYLEVHLSVYLPAWISQEALINALMSRSSTQRSITLLLAVLLSGFVAPIVEELYFRGFLLPRMEHWGWVAPVVSSLLFAVYHFYFPGNVLGIFLAFLPISYVVMIKQNWKIGAITHMMFNLWGVFSVFTFVSKAA